MSGAGHRHRTLLLAVAVAAISLACSGDRAAVNAEPVAPIQVAAAVAAATGTNDDSRAGETASTAAAVVSTTGQPPQQSSPLAAVTAEAGPTEPDPRAAEDESVANYQKVREKERTRIIIIIAVDYIM